MRNSIKNSKKKLYSTALLLVIFGLTGCESYIERVDVNVPGDIQSFQLSLVFTDNVKLKFEKSFKIKDYGTLDVKKYSSSQPFSLNLNLKTSIVDEQDFVNIAPTYTLPNGFSTGVPHALVQVNSPNPLDPNFDLFGYVDVIHRSWLGVAVIFGFLKDEDFPRDMSVSQIFKRDSDGKPALLASVFGPEFNANGTLKRAPGAAVFGNFKELVNQRLIEVGSVSVLRAESEAYSSSLK